MNYDGLKPEVKNAYARVRSLDDYRWDLLGEELLGIHKKSELPVRIKFAATREEAEKLSESKEGYGVNIIVVPKRGVFYIQNGAFILSVNYLRSTLVDINDHIVWHGFKVVEDDGRLIQEDYYEYLGGLMIEHLRNNMTSGQDYVFWQFYKCEKCGKYVDIDSVPDHMEEHGVNIADRNEELYEVFELNFIKGKVFNKFGKEVKESELSEEAKAFIKEMFRDITPMEEEE